MSNANWTKIRILLALALASAPLVDAATAAPTVAVAKKHKKRHKRTGAAAVNTGAKKARKHKNKNRNASRAAVATSAAGSGAATEVNVKTFPTGLTNDENITRNYKHIPGKSRLLFYNPTTDDTRAIGTDGVTQYHLVNGIWNQEKFLDDMSGYFAVSTSGKALSDQQVDALVRAGDLAMLAEKALQIDLIAKQNGTFTLTDAETKAINDMRQAAIAQGNIFVAGLGSDGKLIHNRGISSANLQGTNWDEVDSSTGLYELPGGVKQIAINGLTHVWGINESNEVSFKASLDGKDDWEFVEGLRKQIVINNKDHVWSIDNDTRLYIRTGISNIDPIGSGWAQIPGGVLNIAINDNNMVYFVGTDNHLWTRTEVTDANPAGLGEMHIGAPSQEPISQISINNQNQLWAIGAQTGTAYVLAGITAENPAGTTWTAIPGKLKQIAATNNGAWCIDDSNKVFFREGVTADNPAGTGWAGPFPHDLNYIFAAGVDFAEPVIAPTPIIKTIQVKQVNHHLFKLKHRLESLQTKVTTATGASKQKLEKRITSLEKRIARLEGRRPVAANTATRIGKKNGKNKRAKVATTTATKTKKT